MTSSTSKERQNFSVLATIFQTLKEVISARSMCASWLKSQTDDDETNISNAQHQQFIDVLQKVEQILYEAERLQSSTESSKNTPKLDEVTRLGNIFDFLEVKELAEWNSSSLPTNTSKPDKPKSDPTYELETTDEEVSLRSFVCSKTSQTFATLSDRHGLSIESIEVN